MIGVLEATYRCAFVLQLEQQLVADLMEAIGCRRPGEASCSLAATPSRLAPERSDLWQPLTSASGVQTLKLVQSTHYRSVSGDSVV